MPIAGELIEVDFLAAFLGPGRGRLKRSSATEEDEIVGGDSALYHSIRAYLEEGPLAEPERIEDPLRHAKT